MADRQPRQNPRARHAAWHHAAVRKFEEALAKGMKPGFYGTVTVEIVFQDGVPQRMSENVGSEHRLEIIRGDDDEEIERAS